MLAWQRQTVKTLDQPTIKLVQSLKDKVGRWCVITTINSGTHIHRQKSKQ